MTKQRATQMIERMEKRIAVIDSEKAELLEGLAYMRLFLEVCNTELKIEHGPIKMKNLTVH
jgi:hypothetical protein